ncbi:glycosyl hydrolase family 8 [Paucibacter sp. M5-1]|uniref:glycosyl hydrolase family 8 n=1 Tax=Paucibacter sp. M5-1 TaxID=3015998 RepID=UPI0022B90FC6|nr:glycosyl hydrolase family 8 [Paucibacter sp. M5-1]MCZ7883026.1 glycosyl hydrolase family 8 [Paucibacter sp. M5-1]
MLGFAGTASAAVLEPYEVTVQYQPGATVASAVIRWKADAPRAYGFDVRRRVSGSNDWVRVRYASEPVRSFTDTNLKPLVRYEYQVVAYRKGGPSTGYASAAVGTALDFPYGVAYPNGITPSNYSQAQKDADVLAMYDKWKARYLTTAGAGPGGVRVYKPAPDNQESVSEGVGYGMLISVYMARADNSGKADFDGLLTYYNSKRRPKTVGGVTTPGLMAWRVNADGSVADWFAAPDGDLDAAYSLLVADKKWGSSGAINYKAEALSVIQNLMQWAVYNNNADPTKNSYLMTRFDLGAPTSIEATNSYTMSSYQMVQYFKQFKDATADGRWDDVLRAGYKLYDYFYNNSKSPGGTQIGLTPFTFQTYPDPAFQYLKVPSRGYNYGLDSGRVPWRVGLDYLWYGTANSSRAAVRPESVNLARDLPRINVQWMNSTIQTDPRTLFAQYALDGLPSTSAKYDQRAVVAPMVVAAMTDASNQQWLNAMYDWLRVQVPGVNYVHPLGGQTINAGYFADTVMMICMIAITGNMPNLPDIAPQ